MNEKSWECVADELKTMEQMHVRDIAVMLQHQWHEAVASICPGMHVLYLCMFFLSCACVVKFFLCRLI